MGSRLGGGLLLVAVTIALAATPAGATTPIVHGIEPNWEILLPAMPSDSRIQPTSVPFCAQPSVACIDTEIQRMTAAQQQYGCDHRGVFATTYLELTKQFREDRDTNPHRFADPSYLETEDALFADVFFNTMADWDAGRPVPAAWRIALQTDATGQVNAAQDMLLGINAHVQNDMAFVVAALGTRMPDGTSRKADHDAFNDILDDAYKNVVDAITQRFDPMVGLTNSDLTPLDDFAGLQLVRGWRETVWRNAERLLAAKTDAQRQAVADSIEENAAAWAAAIAATPQPGYRAIRDAYCASRTR
jgi:hypothetical protein